ncbi:hypothetical protein C8R43DRAFT_1000579 [Mycena crocata]|nr:hypothetical protein C8R43DRAFT_1000579 [Mycena crocata]
MGMGTGMWGCSIVRGCWGFNSLRSPQCRSNRRRRPVGLLLISLLVLASDYSSRRPVPSFVARSLLLYPYPSTTLLPSFPSVSPSPSLYLKHKSAFAYILRILFSFFPSLLLISLSHRLPLFFTVHIIVSPIIRIGIVFIVHTTTFISPLASSHPPLSRLARNRFLVHSLTYNPVYVSCPRKQNLQSKT